MWDDKWAMLIYNPNGWTSYIWKLNAAWDWFDMSELQLDAWYEIVVWNFSLDNRRDIFAYNKATWDAKLIITNSDGVSFTETDINWNVWLSVVPANFRWVWVDDILTYDKATWEVYINRLKSDGSFHSFRINNWKPWFETIIAWDFSGEWRDSIFLHDNIKWQIVNWSWRSNNFLLHPNEDWTWFEFPVDNLRWKQWFEYKKWDLEWGGKDWLIQYNPITWQTFLVKINYDKTTNDWNFSIRSLWLKPWFEIYPWNFDNK